MLRATNRFPSSRRAQRTGRGVGWDTHLAHGFLRIPFLGDPDARLQTLLPNEPSFDLAVNVFTYQPGAALPQVEVHVMEHGLLMLDGQGVYRLGDDWNPVRQGDGSQQSEVRNRGRPFPSLTTDE